jgi:5'-nucleotidase
MKDNRYHILLTNDDGIQSPGLWAAAEALSRLGYVTVAAPRDQASGTGRSVPLGSDGRIQKIILRIGQQDWPVYSVGGTPAQTVDHALLELLPEKPDLVVSGINYGENVGEGVTASGTVGAALEAASFGIPAIAASLELMEDSYYNYSTTVDFSSAAYFTAYFAERLLAGRFLPDVDVLKVDVPAHATPQTPWRLARLSKVRYFMPVVKRKGALEEPGPLGYRIVLDPQLIEPDSDIHVLMYNHEVAVCPMSLEMTSRVRFDELDARLRG